MMRPVLWNLTQTLMWMATRSDDPVARVQSASLFSLFKALADALPDGKSNIKWRAEQRGELAGKLMDECLDELTKALQAGGVKLVARLRNSGLSQAIDREACATLRFIDGPPGDEPRAVIDPLAQNDLWWGTLRFRTQEIIKAWPAAPSPPQTPLNRRRGRRPEVMNRVLAQMRAISRPELEGMNQAQMAAEFDAAESTCRKARKIVLGEN
jgi:hypothetical protein